MVALNWQQVNAWRLTQHHLLPRAGHRELHAVVTRIGGVQAQVMPAAEWSLGARVDALTPADIQRALWQERTLIKTWAMRGTLHLLEAQALPLYVAARRAHKIHRPPSYYTYHGVTPAEYDAILEAIPQTLSDQPLTREQLAEGVAQAAGMPNLRAVLLSGWGALLKPSAFAGEICFGPNQGQNVTFVQPRRWIGDWQPIDPQQAFQEMARRYLAAYGPAMPDDFARWWGTPASQAKKVFRALGAELTPVEVEGRQAWALAATVEPMQSLDAPRSVRLLPQFDAYVIGVARDCDAILPHAYKGRVYRPQGWISAVVLVDGRMQGVWTIDRQRAKGVVQVEMFDAPAAGVEAELQSEAKRLGDFLGSDLELTFAE
jgi:hypothetical protein